MCLLYSRLDYADVAILLEPATWGPGVARKVFHSFHYRNDVQRASRVKNIGRLEGQQELSPNRWEEVKAQGDQAVKTWINSQMRDKSCLIVLIGAETANRKWVRYEIQHAWDNGKGVVGVNIHNLVDLNGYTSSRGPNPFDRFTINGVDMSSIVKRKNPAGDTSKAVYNRIVEMLPAWVEEAIEIRKQY